MLSEDDAIPAIRPAVQVNKFLVVTERRKQVSKVVHAGEHVRTLAPEHLLSSF
jgi:hypothetical protein